MTNRFEIAPVAIDRFTRLMCEQLVSGDVAARKAHLSAVVDTVVVSDSTIRIIGSNDNIRATLGPKDRSTTVVRKSVQEWRAVQNKEASAYIIEKYTLFLTRRQLPRQNSTSTWRQNASAVRSTSARTAGCRRTYRVR